MVRVVSLESHSFWVNESFKTPTEKLTTSGPRCGIFSEFCPTSLGAQAYFAFSPCRSGMVMDVLLDSHFSWGIQSSRMSTDRYGCRPNFVASFYPNLEITTDTPVFVEIHCYCVNSTIRRSSMDPSEQNYEKWKKCFSLGRFCVFSPGR
jgi:hypothetical protein